METLAALWAIVKWTSRGFPSQTASGEALVFSLLLARKNHFTHTWRHPNVEANHYSDVIMSMMASQITRLAIVYSIVCSGADQRKQQSSVSLAFVMGIHRSPVNIPEKGPVTWKLFPFDDVIMTSHTRDVTITLKQILEVCICITYPCTKYTC